MLARRSQLIGFLVTLGCACTSPPGDAGPGNDAGDAGTGGSAGIAGDAQSDVEADAPRLSVSATVRENPNLVVSAFVDVEALGASTAVVRYGDDTTYALSTPPATLDARGRGAVLVLGLTPGATSQLIVDATGPEGSGHSDALTFDAPAAPSELTLPTFTVTLDDGAATGFLLGEFHNPSGNAAVILDRSGRLFWYHVLVGVTYQIGAFSRLPGGNLIVHQVATRSLDEVDPGGALVKTWTVDPAASPTGIDLHEFQLYDATQALVIGSEVNHDDSTGFLIGGGPDAERDDGTVLLTDGAGHTRRVWSSYPLVKLNELTLDPGLDLNGMKFDPVHVNAIDVAPDGNLIVSCRRLSQIIKIDITTGAVLWRLGGVRGGVQFVDDPLGGFSMQHDARFEADGTLRVFDNGSRHATQETRVVWYRIDETVRTATLVREVRHTPALFTMIGGSARVIPGSRLLVDYPLANTATEYDSAGVARWELFTPGSGAYRLEWAASAYP